MPFILLFVLALAYPVKPVARVTPGEVRSLSLATVCTTKWGRDVRKVTTAMKQHVAAAYGVPWSEHAKYEFDHLVPRSLAGADSERNLWPQRYDGEWNAHRKDVLENRLHMLVCAGSLPLGHAQQAIRLDWVDAYRRYVVVQKPASHGAARAPSRKPN